jgi:hypothetical protein
MRTPESGGKAGKDLGAKGETGGGDFLAAAETRVEALFACGLAGLAFTAPTLRAFFTAIAATLA